MRPQLAPGALNLSKIAGSGQCFRWEPLGGETYLIPLGGKTLRIAQTPDGAVDAACAPVEWDTLWRPYFDLDTDYAAILADVDPADPYLCAAAAAGSGIRILRQDFFETLVSFIVSQNNNIPRIRKILAALCATAAAGACGAGGAAFPAPEALAALTDVQLARAGLGYRAPYVRETAKLYADAPFRASADEPTASVIERLRLYPGVGEKVASCVALFSLGRKDAFPVDVWVRRILETRYGGRFPRERYAAFAGVYQQYMFYYERLLDGVA